MKQRVWFLYAIPFILIIAIGVGGFWLLEEVFPKAPEIDLPGQQEILSAHASSTTDLMGVIVDIPAEDQEALLTLLARSIPTRMQSVNDSPSVRPYYEFRLKTEKRSYSYFVYLEDGQLWLEMPYTGIYRTGSELLDLAKAYTLP